MLKAVEPSAEFQKLHSQATTAFIDENLDEAEDLAIKAIEANPEMFAAHSLLSEIYLAQGDRARALSALFNAAHTKPRDPETWRQVALLILERVNAEEDRKMRAEAAAYCYNRIVGLEPEDDDARLQRATLSREAGRWWIAMKDFARLVQKFPDNSALLRDLAGAYLEGSKSAEAIPFYEEALAICQAAPNGVERLDWSDANIYCELFLESGLFQDGIVRVKRMFRWLLGRGEDDLWDDLVDQDDREFDVEHEPRRTEVEGFDPGTYPISTYGIGLPLELRIKLGIFRLKQDGDHLEEAISHFEFLEPEPEFGESKLFDYPDLFKDTGDALQSTGFFREALRFYEPIQQVDSLSADFCYSGMASCYRGLGMFDQAEQCYRVLIESDETDIEALQAVIKMYHEARLPHRAIPFIKELHVRRPGGHELEPERRVPAADEPINSIDDDEWIPEFFQPDPPKKPEYRRRRPYKRLTIVTAQQEDLSNQFHGLHQLEAQLASGDKAARIQWIEAAAPLIERFRSVKLLFPDDRTNRFFGFSKEARKFAGLKRKQQEEAQPEFEGGTPLDFCQISFDEWFETFMKYGLYLAEEGRAEEAYAAIRSARDCNIWVHSKETMLTIHVTWALAALINSDSKAICDATRWVLLSHQFVTDAYRLYAALHLLCPPPNVWYNGNASQKFFLRQVKAVDFSLLGDARAQSLFNDRARLSQRDAQGQPIPAADMDVALLMLYGQILYAGGSYAFALNYFFRCLALDPANVLVRLSAGLACVHHALRRQADNRHRWIVQGLSFLLAYLERREQSPELAERQEAQFNLGRTFHMLGLAHLAVPYYERCLELSEEMRQNKSRGPVDAHGDVVLSDADATDGEAEDDYTEDFVLEAAYALQNIWLASENMEQAMAVTEKWLVI